MSKTPISALILTRNEERCIARCLRSLAWADEIVVIDAESSDRTVEICQDPAAPWAGRVRVVTRAWTGFRDQRNFSLAQARHDWVLVVDADEQCTPELARRIRELLDAPGGPTQRYWKVRRREYFLGQEIHHGIWSPGYQDRFFHRSGIAYVNDIHEYPQFPSAPGWIEEALLHDPEFSVERFLDKMNKYTSVEARERYAAGFRTNLFHTAFAPVNMFYKTYLYYGGWKDGRYGFMIALMEALSRLTRHLKVWQLQQLEAREKGRS
jgi:glycosyltransferase involved in cell wall biosynthesis